MERNKTAAIPQHGGQGGGGVTEVEEIRNGRLFTGSAARQTSVVNSKCIAPMGRDNKTSLPS